MGNGLSRRNFLKGGAAVAAVAAGATALSGCSSSSSETPSWMPKSWDYETDVLVIGYGGAGMWAACTAHDEGAEALILEKAPYRGGGSSSMNCGQWTLPNDADKAAEYAYNCFHGYTPKDVCQAWADEAVKNGDYADDFGFEWAMYNNGEPRVEYELEGWESMCVAMDNSNGPGFFETMDQNVKDRGIEVIFDCHDEELIQNPDTKEIVGCYTKIGSDDTMHAVKARKAVIMTTGGFEFNEELKAKYLKCYPMRGFYGWKFNTGDGIKMVQRVGADLRSMGLVMGGWSSWFNDPEIVPGGISVSAPSGNYIWVNSVGKRWRDETISLNHGGWKIFMNFNEDECNYDCIPSWYIFDQTCFDAGTWGDFVAGLAPENGGLNCGYCSLPEDLGGWQGWSKDNKWELERGWIKQGDSIEELVEKINAFDENACNMTAETLQATIDRWNEMCDKGVDEDFGRTASEQQGPMPGASIGLGKIQGPPYYAMPIYPGLGNTLGGPNRDATGCLIDCDGNQIPRLYGAGSFCNMASHTYAITGGNNAENWCWGRITGRNAAALSDWDATK